MNTMDRERLLIGLWAMASACWICLVLATAITAPIVQSQQATFLLAMTPPVLTIVSGYLIAWVLRGPVERPRRPNRPAP